MPSLSSIASRIDKLEKALGLRAPILTVSVTSFVHVGPILGWKDRAETYYERLPGESDEDLCDRASTLAQAAGLIEPCTPGGAFGGIVYLTSVNGELPEDTC